MEAVYIISAAVLNTVFNGFWVNFIQNKWRSVWSIPPRVNSNNGPTPYLISFIGSLWASYGLFLMIKHIQPRAMDELLTTAIGTWLFVLIAMSAKYYAFEGKRVKELVVDYTQDLISLIVMSYMVWFN